MSSMLNNYFKIHLGKRLQIFTFNDQSDISMTRAFSTASILARGAPIVVWKRFLGLPDFVRVVGEVLETKPAKVLRLAPRTSPAEPNGGADDYPSEEEENEAPVSGEASSGVESKSNGALTT